MDETDGAIPAPLNGQHVDVNVNRSPRRLSSDGTSPTPLCSQDSCNITDSEKNKFQCSLCHRFVHYRCTALPPYQIAHFKRSGYRNFICISCTVVPEKLQNIIPRPPSQGSNKETSAMQVTLNQKEIEVDSLAQTNRFLSNKIKDLTRDMQKQEEEYKKEKHLHLELQAKVNTMQSCIKNYEDKIVSLQNTTTTKDDVLSEHDQFAKISDLVTKKLEAVESSLKETVLTEISNSNRVLEERMNDIIHKTYADQVKNLSENATPIINTPAPATSPPDLRSIMREQQNDHLVQERDKKQRSCNLVIHGIMENNSDDRNLAKTKDDEFVKNFFTDIGLDLKHKSLFRLGSTDNKQAPHKRPLKIVMSSEQDKDRITANLRKLKGQDKYVGISVKDDLTIQERETIKDWVEKAKDANNKEDPESEYEWRVRGSPKNGLLLKKFRKRDLQH